MQYFISVTVDLTLLSLESRSLTFDQIVVMDYFTGVMHSIPKDTVAGRLRLGIVDDQKATIHSLEEVFRYSKKVDVTLTARSGHDLLLRLKQTDADHLPQIILTDVNMPGINGIEVVRQGKALYPHIHFIMLTVFDDDDTLFQAIQAGASGYLLKGEKSAIILGHIERFFEEGATPLSPLMARRTLDMLAHIPKPVSGSDVTQLEGLSSREKDVLYLLVDGLDYKEIALRLSISPNTVRTHISNVYEKLHISSKAQAIRLMQGRQSKAESVSGPDKTRILLVDDHEMILESLAMMLSAVPDFEVIGKLSDPDLVKGFLDHHQVHIIVSDINMPKKDGLQLARELKSTRPDLRMLMLTVSEDSDLVNAAKNAGAEGYVFKKATRDELTKAIREIANGGTYYQGQPDRTKQVN